MNAEIYFPRNGRAFGQTSEKSFEDTIKKLAGSNVHIIYKTEVNLTEDSIVEALKVTDSGEEKIGMIFIADALESDSMQKAKRFFDEVGIVGKVRRIEAECKDPLDEYSDSSKEPKEAEEKKKKKKNKKNTPESEEELIDISGSYVSIEKKKLYAYTVEYKNKLIVLLPPAENLDTTFCTVLYTAAKKVVSPKKKRAFWKKFIPCKGDGPFDVIRKIILILALCTFLVSSYMLLNILVIEPWKNDMLNKEIAELKSQGTKTDDNAKKAKDGSDGILSDFSKLVEKNSDTVGWITVPNTPIDYVVVRSKEDEQKVANDEDPYYLYKDFYGNHTKYGTVFMDYRSNLDSKNMILHGHHMQDGRMFAKLTEFNDLDRYKGTPVFTFDTIYEKAKWKIIAVIKTNTLKWQGDPVFNYLRGSFSSDYDFLNFVYQLRVRSIIDCPVTVNENDTLVTLSTCCYDFEEFRFVIVARKVRDGESASVDLSKADYNPTPLYPQICHDYWGVEKPLVTSFQDAYNNGRINWYDGDGKWSDEDDQELTRALVEGKENAEKMLREGYNKEDYKQEQLEEIENIITLYMAKINNANKGSDVNELYSQAVTEIRKVKTIKDLENEEKEKKIQEENDKKKAISDLRYSSINEIRQSVSGREYRTTQYDKVKKIIDEYEKKINKATDSDVIAQLKNEALGKLSEIKTSSELDDEEASKRAEEEASRRAEEEASRRAEEEASRRAEEELSEYKENAVSLLNGYMDTSLYSDSVKARLDDLILEYTGYINNASSQSAVDGLLSEAKKYLDLMAKDESREEEDSDESSDESSEEESEEESAA